MDLQPLLARPLGHANTPHTKARNWPARGRKSWKNNRRAFPRNGHLVNTLAQLGIAAGDHDSNTPSEHLAVPTYLKANSAPGLLPSRGQLQTASDAQPMLERKRR